MVRDFIYQVLLMLVGAIIPPTVPWVLTRLQTSGFLKPRPATLRITAVPTIISVFLSVFFITLYDRGLFPFTRIANVQTGKHEFGVSYPNHSGHTMLVTVSAFNNAIGNTMCAAIAENAGDLRQSKPSDCKNTNTVASASFAANGHHSSMTFVVPRGYWYNVVTNGGTITIGFWTESIL